MGQVDDRGVRGMPVVRTEPAIGRLDALGAVLDAGAARAPNATAVEHADGSLITYGALLQLADATAAALRDLGIGAGDRVGIHMPKSIDAVAAILGVLRAGAAYVPIDPQAPPVRAVSIIDDCRLAALFLTRTLLGPLDAAGRPDAGPLFVLETAGSGDGLAGALAAGPDGAPVAAPRGPADLAYVLYTSGSTGRPKGVMLTHTNALSFLDWCGRTFCPQPDDRFSSHAPLHFDLSILDLFLPLACGATLVLFDPEESRNPRLLAARIEERRITSWYSAPSILSMLVQYGRLEERDLAPLRRVLFAGEVFPVKYLRALQRLLPGREYYNLYGPTETNVCTWYRIPDEIPDERTEPYPVGVTCDHVRTRVVDADGRDLEPGASGELCVTGDGVMVGYWDRPEESARAFLVDAEGVRWYRTGDIVHQDAHGDFVFQGRRDRMVKRRGYRIELGDIEAGLYRHAAVQEVAVIALRDADDAVRIRAVLSFGDGERPSQIELKTFCAGVLPLYMVPDEMIVCAALPKTSTDKVDLQALQELR